MEIRINVTRERLRELRNRKDFWSEVVFQQGYSLAPTYPMAETYHLQASIPAPLPQAVGREWQADVSAGIRHNKAEPWPITSRDLPVSPDWSVAWPTGFVGRQAA